MNVKMSIKRKKLNIHKICFIGFSKSEKNYHYSIPRCTQQNITFSIYVTRVRQQYVRHPQLLYQLTKKFRSNAQTYTVCTSVIRENIFENTARFKEVLRPRLQHKIDYFSMIWYFFTGFLFCVLSIILNFSKFSSVLQQQ